MNINEKYLSWINNPKLENGLMKELQSLKESEIEDCFYCDIEFGTAGMRGKMGPGTNRMNIYTVLKACRGYLSYLKKHNMNGVAIAYDNRNNSKLFAEASAYLLAKNDIDVYLFDSLRPTPELSFTVRYYKCAGGIMVTASHNPKEYNGYKIYDNTGCQIIPSIAKEITNEINNIEDIFDIDIEYDLNLKKIHIVNRDVDEAYYKNVLSIQLRPYMNKDIKIAFSPEHGASYIPVKECLTRAGYSVYEVENQSVPDGNFSCTASPNPEERKAYDGVIEKGKSIMADLILVCDPDGDRMGVGIRKGFNYFLFNGNQTGALLLEYILHTRKELNEDFSNAIMFNTIVTSDIGESVAKHYGVKCEKTLTGFKYIGNKVLNYEKTNKRYIFGYEESYGSLVSPFVRDKDATQACVLLAEACQYYKHCGKDLFDILNQLYLYNGAYYDTQLSIKLDGSNGKEKLGFIMNGLRDNVPIIKGFDILYYEDYLYQKKYENDTIENIVGFDKADVLKYVFKDGSFIAIRPSGTEPKCKIYISANASTYGEAFRKADSIQKQLKEIIK